MSRVQRGSLHRWSGPARLALFAVIFAIAASALAPLARATGDATIWTDKADYHPEEIVTIFGAGFAGDSSVSVSVTRPNGQVDTWETTSNLTGDFETTYPLDGIVGVYVVEATDGINTATTSFTDAPAINLDQCANGSLANYNVKCGTASPSPKWQNGDLNKQNSQYREGDGIPYRVTLTGLSSGSHTLTLGYDFTHGGKFALDRLAIFDLTQKSDPCASAIGITCTLGAVSLSPSDIPGEVASPDSTHPSLPNGGNLFTFTGASGTTPAHLNDVTNGRRMAAWVEGGTLTWGSMDANVVQSGSSTANSARQFGFSFTLGGCSGSGCKVLFAWAGHIAAGVAMSNGGWGTGNGASAISGAPFHMNIVDFDGTGGSQDRSVQINALIPSALIVIKHVINDNGGTAGASDFTITVTATNPVPASFPGAESPGTAVGLDTGSFSVGETGPSGYTSGFSSDCSGTIAQGETKTCIVTNDDSGATLIVIKHVINDNGGTAGASDFTMTVTGGSPSPGSFPGTESPGTAVSLNAGAYTVSETGPSGYSESFSADCAGSIALGQTKTCTVTNDDRAATLIVTKHVVNDNGGTAGASDFTITVTGSAPSPGTFPGAESPGTGVTINAGGYSVSESGPTGYSASFSADCSGTIAVGQTKTCTITNDDNQPKVIVIKHVVNDNGGIAVAGDFTITVIGNAPSPGTFSGAESPGTTVLLNAGAYSVGESGPGGYSGSFSADCSGTIAVGQTKTCTITNDDQAATLIVIKHVVNDNGGTKVAGDFTITVTGSAPSPGTFPGAESPGTSVTINAGAYSVSETGAGGYSASLSADCAGTISVGEIKTCTVSNDDIVPQLTVVKHVINDNGGTALAGSFTMSVSGTNVQPSTTFPGNEAGTTVTLNQGSYTVAESGPSGYSASFSADCVGSIAVGETKTCTITNDDVPPSLVLVKYVTNNNGGTRGATEWTLTASGPTPISGAGGASSGPSFSAGTYTLSESGPSDYTAGTWFCIGGLQTGDQITLALGQSATCSIVNDDIAPRLTLIKHVDNGVSIGGSPPSAFTVTATGPTTLSGPGPTVTSGAGFAAGTYGLSEAGPSGYDASGWTCTGASVGAGNTIVLVLAQSATCEITNTKRGRIIAEKHTHGGTGSFDFTLSGLAGPLRGGGSSVTHTLSTSPSGTGSTSFDDLVATGVGGQGTYALEEAAQPGWTLISGSCSDGSPPGAISLQPGEVVTCTFDNVVKNLVTDSALCTFDRDTGVAGSQFRLLFTQDPLSPAYYKVTATNPGQFFYNIFVVGTGTVLVHVQIPYPFVTQGAQPIHAYDGATIVAVGASECILPGTEIYHSPQMITLGSYNGGFGSFATLDITFPATGFVYLNLHLDYGLKGTSGWTKGTSNQGIGSGPYGGVTILDLGTYVFSYSHDGDGSDSAGIQNENSFKKNPGFGGQVYDSALNGVSGVTVTIYRPDLTVLGSATTDADGYYFHAYKHTGKSATFHVGIPGQMKDVLVKANSFVWVDFQVL